MKKVLKMPLALRSIEPADLGRRSLRDEDANEDIVQVAVTHNVLLGILVQLSNLVRHADDLFCDLAEDCQKVFDQTSSIAEQVKKVKDLVSQLNSKTALIRKYTCCNIAMVRF